MFSQMQPFILQPVNDFHVTSIRITLYGLGRKFEYPVGSYQPFIRTREENMFKTLTSAAAAQLDRELMSTGAFSIDQLMELAGLAVAQAIHREYHHTSQRLQSPLLVLVGPGNNGGDGLVACRHLKLWGYNPMVYYPKKSKSNELYQRLLKQLHDFEVPEVSEITHLFQDSTAIGHTRPFLIVDALFGFSFKPPIRPPFDEVLAFLCANSKLLPPVVSIDIPSGWDVDSGPGTRETALDPKMLVSLSAPKPCALHFAGSDDKVHYLGGRFISKTIADKYGISELTKLYQGDEMIVKL